MKNLKYVCMAMAAVLSAAACTKEIPASETPASDRLVINAVAGSLAPAGAAKAHGEYCYEVLWDDNDRIAVTGASGQGEFKLIEGSGTTLGKFEQVSGPTLTGDVTGYYPASLLQDGNVVWPAEQKYSAQLTGVPMSATATVSQSGTNFSFKSIGGVLQLVLTSSEGDVVMKSITVSADNLDQPVTLDCGSVTVGAAAKNFAISLPAASYSNMQLRFEAADGAVLTMRSSSLPVTRGVVSKVTLVLSGFSRPFPNYLSFTAVGRDIPVYLTRRGNPDTIPLEYCMDPVAGDWQPFTADGSGPTDQLIAVLDEGRTIYLRGVSVRTNFSKSKNDSWQFKFDNVSIYYGTRIVVGGNIMSLLDPELKSTEVGNYAFSNLFYFVNEIVSAPELPAVKLGTGCYYRMFFQCKNLTEAPVLPATDLPASCYYEMFGGSGLRSSAIMYGTSLSSQSCYGMYQGCSSLVKANPLPAMTLGTECYSNMFDECSSLQTAPALPATTMVERCYRSMFNKCFALKTAPALPSTSLAPECYYSMFSLCSSLEAGPELPAAAIEENSCCYMFNCCSSLKSLTVNITSWDSSTCYWMTNVSPTGVFYCPASLPLVYGGDNIPVGWKVVHTSVPSDTAIGTLIYCDGIESMLIGEVEKGRRLAVMTKNLGADDNDQLGDAYSVDDLQELKGTELWKKGWRLPTEKDMTFLAKYASPFLMGSTLFKIGDGSFFFHYTQNVDGGKRESRHWLADEDSCFWFRSDGAYGRTSTSSTAVDEFYVRLVKEF